MEQLKGLKLQDIVERASTDKDFARQFVETATRAATAGIGAHDAAWVAFVNLFASSPNDLVNLLDSTSEGARLLKALLGGLPTVTGHTTEVSVPPTTVSPPNRTAPPEPGQQQKMEPTANTSEGAGAEMEPKKK